MLPYTCRINIFCIASRLVSHICHVEIFSNWDAIWLYFPLPLPIAAIFPKLIYSSAFNGNVNT